MGCCQVLLDGGVPYRDAEDCLALDKGDRVAGQEVVLGGWRLVAHERIFLTHVVAEFQVVMAPGVASMRLLASSGSTNFLANNVSQMSDFSSALG